MRFFGPRITLELCQRVTIGEKGTLKVAGLYRSLCTRALRHLPRPGDLLKGHYARFRVIHVEHDINTGDVTVYAQDVEYSEIQ